MQIVVGHPLLQTGSKVLAGFVQGEWTSETWGGMTTEDKEELLEW